MWRAQVRCVLFFFTSALFIVAGVHAQERGGTITGRVNDAGRYVLPGARIELQPRGPATVSDQQGLFTITNVPPGEYTMTIQVVDETFPDKRRPAEKSLPIHVVAAPANP